MSEESWALCLFVFGLLTATAAMSVVDMDGAGRQAAATAPTAGAAVHEVGYVGRLFGLSGVR